MKVMTMMMMMTMLMMVNVIIIIIIIIIICDCDFFLLNLASRSFSELVAVFESFHRKSLVRDLMLGFADRPINYLTVPQNKLHLNEQFKERFIGKV